MIRFARAQVHPIGLDIGHDGVKMIQLERVGDSLSVLAAARAPLPPEARAQPQLCLPLAAEAVREMRRRGGFRGRKVVAALPPGITHIRNLRLTPMPPSELAAAVRREARSILPIDPANA